MWEQWIKMAQESLEAANQMESIAPRSAVSRYYYAAFQAMTALLHRRGTHPPEGREAWNHTGDGSTPELVEIELNTLIRNRDKRKDMSRRLKTLYLVRVSADYYSQDDVETKLARVGKDAEFLGKVATDTLLKGRL